MKQICKVFWAGLLAMTLSAPAFSRDASRYPSDYVPYSGHYVGHFHQIFKGIFPLSVSLYIDESFDESERIVLEKAMQIFIDRALTPRVVDCTFRQAVKDLPKSREAFQGGLFAALSLRSHKDAMFPGFAFVTSFSDDSNAVGIGYINLFYDRDHPLPGYRNRNYLYVAINRDLLGEHSSYSLAQDSEYWAGVLAHEFLHNLGYVHPTGYPGSFINEYGDCVWNNGTGASRPAGLPGDRIILKD